LTESGQYVQVRLSFDAPVQVDGDVSDDFNVKLNDGDIDSKTVRLSATVQDGDVIVRLQPTADADGRSSSVYFALYEGRLSVSSADASGALPHVLAAQGASGSHAVCAVMKQPVGFTVPSGVQMSTVQAVPGNAASGTCARTVVQVTQFAQLRCVTWIGLSFDGRVVCNEYGMPSYADAESGEGTLAMKHNHLFLRDTQRGCAADMADVIQNTWPDKVTATADGDRVTITSLDAVDGQTIMPFISEGRCADE
jgi:hypothetical protein